MAKDGTNPYLIRDEQGRAEITEVGYEILEPMVTDAHGNVYAFTGELSPVSVAAAMARLSRSPDDMRVILLDEFIGQEGRDDRIVQRIVGEFGDDSVAQLIELPVVVEGASNWLTKQLERGRTGIAYLEQSTRYIYFDRKDRDGKYRYYRPNFDSNTTRFPWEDTANLTLARYERIMDDIFDTYSDVVRRLTEYVQRNSSVPEGERDGRWRAACRAQACDAVRPLLPVATLSTVGIVGTAQALENMIMRLMSEEIPEARETGDKVLKQVRKVTPAFFQRADRPDKGGITIAYRAITRSNMRALAERYLQSANKDGAEAAKLIRTGMNDEFDLLPYMLYEVSDLAVEEIAEQVDGWSDEQKLEVFMAYFGERYNRRQRHGRAIEHLGLTFDVVSDYGIFRDLQRHRIVNGMEWQRLTPYYGYEIPRLVSEAGMEREFEQCFSASLELYEVMVAAGHVAEAQYATLLGHKMRWKFEMNAREAFHMIELRTAPGGHPGYRRLCNQMYRSIAEKFPNLAIAMKFVNQGEDPELTRLGSERAAELRQQRLSAS